jgi:glycosyltransferase involved in cell wall biosynthesis
LSTTLYLTRNGLLEPLGQSQVLPYLRRLARDYRIILVTREKTGDWTDAQAMAEAHAECKALGIEWRPRQFRPRPRYLGPARDIAGMIQEALRTIRHDRAILLHARSYIPAAVAWLVWRMSGIPFIFDMRALWPEELIAAGRLRRGSFTHRLIAKAERTFLRDAAGVVSLTDAAADYLRKRDPAMHREMRIAVIPTCTDLARFTPRPRPLEAPRVHGCVGTILSGWFRADWLGAWFANAAQMDPQALFEIVTQDDPMTVRAAIDPRARLGPRLTIASRSPRDMPEAICGHDLSVMFFTGGLSKLGSAPTRMGEVLGSGLPVVANGGVGDVARIITEHRVGVIVKGPGELEMAEAYAQLCELLGDSDLAARCRRTAEALFSLEVGADAYREIYRSILLQERGVRGRAQNTLKRSGGGSG